MPRIITTEIILERFKKKWATQYDYSNVVYINAETEVEIICHKEGHGPFRQLPHSHAKGHQGCHKCKDHEKKHSSKKQSLDQIEVICRFKKAWKDWKTRYNYSRVEYKNQNKRVEIKCLKLHWKTGNPHGIFKQKPIDHWLGKQGCDDCKADNARKLYLKSSEQFLKDAKEIYGEYYDYSLVDYKGAKEDVILICPIHNEFSITPDSHINARCGCSKCGDERGALKNATPFEIFEKRATRVHQNKYKYFKEDYTTGSRETKFLCPKHGEKWQLPWIHAKGHGCNQCANEANKELQRKKQELDFKKVLKAIYGKKYTVTGFFLKEYSNGNLRRWASLKCDEHGPFDMPCPSLKSQGSIGCKTCKKNKIGDANRKSTQEFIAQATLLHNGIYDYSDTVYIDAKSRITYRCPHHGLVSTQTADTHLRPSGCRKCADEELVGFFRADTMPPEQPYGIYLLEITNTQTRDKFLKVGLSKTTIKQRMASLQKLYTYNIIAYEFATYSKVFQLADVEWKNEIKDRDLMKIPEPRLKSEGNTECSEYNTELLTKYSKAIFDLSEFWNPNHWPYGYLRIPRDVTRCDTA